MKFIIFVAGRIRNGQRVGLPDFPYSETYEKYVYQCRELTAEEFNAVSAIVFSPNYRTNGFSLCPMAIEAVAIEPVVETTPETPPSTDDNTNTAGHSFFLDGKSIFYEGGRIAYLAGAEKQLRINSEHAELRPQIEAWLETLTPSEQ